MARSAITAAIQYAAAAIIPPATTPEMLLTANVSAEAMRTV
jgi:hypothetical protein